MNEELEKRIDENQRKNKKSAKEIICKMSSTPILNTIITGLGMTVYGAIAKENDILSAGIIILGVGASILGGLSYYHSRQFNYENFINNP